MSSMARSLATRFRHLGWLTVLAFTIKGTVTTTLIVWAALQAARAG